jgi:hypothetical protein
MSKLGERQAYRLTEGRGRERDMWLDEKRDSGRETERERWGEVEWTAGEMRHMVLGW